MTKLFIATPMYGGQCYGWHMQSVMGLQDILMRHNVVSQLKVYNLPLIESQHAQMFNESLIPRGRNALTRGFLKSDCTHLFFIDADIKFNPADVLGMIMADKELIGGIYPKKEINWESVKRAVLAGVPVEELKHHTASWVLNLVGGEQSITVPINQPIEVMEIGTGFMLVKREVFDKLAPTTETYLNDVNDLSGTITAQEEIYNFFHTPIHPTSRRLLSEDYAFCHKWRDIGGKVWAAPWVTLAHAGTYLYEGRFVPVPPPAAATLPSPEGTA